MGPYFPFNCGNLLVASQYALPLRIILKYCKPTTTILDWGCGEGHFSYLLMQQNYQVHSYSYSESDLTVVREKAKTSWRLFQSECQDPVSLPFQDQSYDAVISLGVLEHVRESGGNEEGSLKEIYRLLKPGGYFCCFHFPNRYSWIEALSRGAQRLGVNKYCHPNLYREKEILELIRTTPFHLVEMKKYQLLPRRILRLVPKRLAWGPTPLYIYNALEKLFALCFSPFSQNYYFVLRK